LRAVGLKPETKYVLCLNGYPNHSSNEILKRLCEVYKPTGEGFCNFEKVTSDRSGSLDVEIRHELPRGEYQVKFLIKEYPSWLTVIAEDLVKFRVL
jgi:hypothetical protein